MRYTRASALRGFRSLAEELGSDPGDVLHRAGIASDTLDDNDALVPTHRVATCLRLAAEATGCDDFVFRLVGRQDVRVLGPLAVGLTSAPTVGDAFVCAERYLFVHSPSADLDLRPDPRGEPGVMALHFAADGDPLGAVVALALAHRVATIVSGGPYGLRGVHVPGAPEAPSAAYSTYFGAPVRFRTGEAVLRVPQFALGHQIEGRDALLHRMAVDYLESHRRVAAATVASRVHQLVAHDLGPELPTLDAVAHALNLHPRTLQRRLADEGTTYGRVLDAARRERAGHLITTTDLPMTRVAALVGLSDAAVLTRATRRWFSLTPTELRRRGPERVRTT